MTPQPEFVPVAVVAERLTCSPDSVLRLMRAGELAGFRHGRLVRIRASSVDAFVARHSATDQLGPRRRRRATRRPA